MILSFFAFTADEDGTHSKVLDELVAKWENLKQAVKSSKPSFSDVKSSIKNTITSLKESKAAAQGSAEAYEDAGDSAEKLSLKMILLRGRALLLNAALGLGVGLLVSWAVKTATNIANSVDNAASKAKEASDAATNTTSSLKDLTDAYEELGDKSKWDTDDFDQAKDIQAEIFDLAKEQGTLDEDKLRSLNLQNGKYQEQLELLKQIKEEQIRAATDDYEKDADKQGKKLVKDAKDSTGWGPIGEGVTVVTSAADHKMAEDLQAHGFNIFKDIAPLGVTLGPTDINDADSIVEYYNQISKALKYLEKNYKETDLESKGVYEGLYNILSSQKDALDDQVSAYQDASDTLKENLEEVGKYDLSNYLAGGKKVSLSHDEIDAKVKATQEYKDAVDEAQKTEEEWNSQGYGKYGNIDNFHRDKIDWTEENLAKYKDFVDEQNSIFPGTIEKGSYSTVLGSWDTISDEDGTEHPFAFTPMLQTDSGLVPLTEDQLWNYIDAIVEQCYDENGKIDIDKLMQLDATGLDEDINGVMMRVKGMIAGVEGGKDTKGRTLTRADILAISGDSNEEIVKDYYGKDADKYYGLGNLSRYVGKSMHDAQKAAQEGKDNIEAVYNQLYNDLENGSSGESDGSSSAPIRYVDHIKSAFETLADSLGKDVGEMTISDVVGLSQDGVQLTDEQAQALDTLTAAADKYGTTIQGVAEAGEENGLFGGIEDATNRAIETAKEMETLSQQIDNIQKAYKACSSAVDEYNKYGYMSADSLQSLLTMDYEYLNCMELVNGKLQLNNEAFAQMVASKYADAKVTAVQNAIAEIQKISLDNVKTSTEKATEAMDGEVNKLNELSPGLGDAIKGTVGLATAQELLNAAEEKSEIDPDRVQTILNGLNTQLSVIDSTIDTILGDSNKIKTHLNGFNKNNNSKSASKSVTDVASAFDTLTKAMKEYNQYGYISADTMKSMMKLEDKFTYCLVKNGDKLEINANEFRKLVETQLKQEEASGKASKSADELKRILSYLDSNVHSSTISFEQLTDVIKGYGTAMDDAKEKTDAIKSAFSGLSEVMSNKTDRSNPFGLLDSDDVEKQHDALMQLAKDTDVFKSKAYNPETGEVDFNSKAFKDSVVEYLNDMADAAAQTGGAGAKAIEKNWRDAAKAIADGKISVEEFYNGLGYSLEKATKEIDDFQSGFSDITDIVDEYNTYGGLSIDNYQKLMALSPDYLSCLKLEGDQLVFNEAAYKQLLIDKLNDMIATYEQTDATKALADRLRELRDGLLNSKTGFKSAKDSAEEFRSAMSDLKDIFSSLLSLFEKFNSNKDSDLKLWGEAMTEDIDKRIDALNKQKEALEDANDEEERAITLAKLQAELEKARTQRTVRKLTSNGYEWVADESAVKEAQDNLNDQQRSWNKEDTEKAIDDQIDKLNELKDKYSEIINLIGTDLDDYNKKLKYASEIAGMTFTEMEGQVDGFKSKVLGTLSAAAPVSSIKNIISSLESLIGTLEKVNNVFEWAQSGFTDYQDKGLQGLFNTVKKFFGKDGTSGDVSNLFEKGWNAIAKGAKSLFSGSGENNLITIFTNGLSGIGDLISKAFSGFGKLFSSGGSGILSGIGKVFSGIGSALGIGGAAALSSVPAMTTANTASLTGLSSVIASNGIAAGAAGTGTAVAGGAAVAGGVSIPVIGAIVAGAALGINSAVKNIQRQKEIWSSDDNTGTKIVKSVGSFLWHASPFGMIVDAIDTVGGWVKKIFGIQDKNNKNNSSSSSANGKINVGDIVINSPDKPASEDSSTSQTESFDKKQSFWDKLWSSKFWFWNWGKKASGSKYIEESAPYNVDEQGPELIVRKPESGRYTYLETGDGVVPADITSKLFELGGNPNKWFSDQLSKHAALSNVQNHTVEGSISVGDIYIQNPVGDTDTLAKEIIRDLPIKLRQQQGRRR